MRRHTVLALSVTTTAAGAIAGLILGGAAPRRVLTIIVTCAVAASGGAWLGHRRSTAASSADRCEGGRLLAILAGCGAMMAGIYAPVFYGERVLADTQSMLCAAAAAAWSGGLLGAWFAGRSAR